MHRNRKTAFTLIEMLVVIAVIAILAAILFPVFAQAREKARQASCLSNVKNLASAILMYAQDYDERLPLGSYTLPTGSKLRWAGQIQPYAKNLQIFTCPSARQFTYGGIGGPTGGYGYNGCFLGGYSVAEIVKPPDTIMLGDSCGVDNTQPFVIRPDLASLWCTYQSGGIVAAQPGDIAAAPRGTPCAASQPAAAAAANPWDRYRVAYRHAETSSVTFVDGHVQALKFGDLNHSADTEDGITLDVLTRFVLWNRY
jgi:prepilin-type N-terminal cleavage/methylation domain-containing protein/prepilin-type processing-associated H-X9-DG protein